MTSMVLKKACHVCCICSFEITCEGLIHLKQTQVFGTTAIGWCAIPDLFMALIHLHRIAKKIVSSSSRTIRSATTKYNMTLPKDSIHVFLFRV